MKFTRNIFHYIAGASVVEKQPSNWNWLPLGLIPFYLKFPMEFPTWNFKKEFMAFSTRIFQTFCFRYQLLRKDGAPGRMVVFQNKSIHKYWFGSLKHRKTKYSIFTQLYENNVFWCKNLQVGILWKHWWNWSIISWLLRFRVINGNSAL